MVKIRKSPLLIVAFLILPFFGGMFDFIFRENQNLYSAYSFSKTLCAILILFAWYQQDTNHIGYRRTALLNLMVIALTIIALPYYFFRSRGLKKGGVYLLSFILLLGLHVAAAVIGTHIGDHFIYPYLT